MIRQRFGARSQLSLIRRDLSEQFIMKYDDCFTFASFQAGLLVMMSEKRSIVVDAFTCAAFKTNVSAIEDVILTKFGMSLTDRAIVKLMGSKRAG